jgi:hypothetical protein
VTGISNDAQDELNRYHLARSDLEVERTLVKKEGTIGALRQHMLEHKFQPREPI